MKKRCAIYTRKSTEERLDIEFNTLDAQREACEAYITSQKADGWTAVNTHYDDGGFSGGNMERPALKQLLDDIKAGKVDIVVVYKIDRLTRSLMDFAKLVEVFDAHNVTFVSVTQSFNTTTSMGRLTLNVLLSFAQFEREVTSERLRDKIAASKKKGMFMGGTPPLGYDIKDKKLVINQAQADTVRFIFDSYLEHGSVKNLHLYLKQSGITSPMRITKKGRTYGGKNYSRGALYELLKNPVYIGKTRHKGKIYDGQHEAIISDDLWHKVQKQLSNHSSHERGAEKQKSGKLLKGKLFDCDGTIYSPTYTVKSGKQYHYYISQNLLQNRDHPKHIMARIPALEIENIVLKTLKEHLSDPEKLAGILMLDLEQYHRVLTYLTKQIPDSLIKDILKGAVLKITLNAETIMLELDLFQLRQKLSDTGNCHLPRPQKETQIITTTYQSARIKDGAIVIKSKRKTSNDNPFDLPKPELKRLIQGIIWRDEYFKGTSLPELAKREDMDVSYMRRLIRYSVNFI